MDRDSWSATDVAATNHESRFTKHDGVPEQAFYMKGGIEEVLEAAEKLKATV